MFSEKAQKHLRLIATFATALAGGLTALSIIIAAFEKWPPWAFWLIPAALLLLALLLLIKWRMRHSRLLKPDALRLDRDNPQHLVGRAEDVNNLLQRCLARRIVFLEGESGSGKSALVRAGLLPGLKDEKAILPLMLTDLWVDHWERGPFQALRMAIVQSRAPDATVKSAEEQPKRAMRPLSTLAEVEQELVRIHDEEMRTPLIIFDQFDDHQARNRERFLPDKVWLDPAALRRANPFWDMIARLLEQDKLHCLFVTRSDTAAGLASVQFLGPVPALRLDRVPTPYIIDLLARLTAGQPDAAVIADPEAGWHRLRGRIVYDISQQDVVLPQQLKVTLGGIQGLRRLTVAQYERAGRVAGIEALYVEQQVGATARKVGLEAAEVRAMLVALIDPSDPNKTRSRSKEQLVAAAGQACGRAIADDRLDQALDELERGEIVRSATDLESGLTAYRLDHDYLTRGVSAAERRANRWHYLLEDGAKSFENAGSLAMRWRALLPVAEQCGLAWERVRGTHRYGQHRTYALWSLARFAPVVVVLGAVGLAGLEYLDWQARDTAQKIWSKFEFQTTGVTDADLDGAWMLAGTSDARVREHFVRHLLNSQEYARRFLRQPAMVTQALTGMNPGIRERIAANLDPVLKSGGYATTDVAAVTMAIRLAKAGSVTPGWILVAIKKVTDDDEIDALTNALETVAPQVNAEDARALVVELMRNLKRREDERRSTVITALATVSRQLKAEDARALTAQILSGLKGTLDPDELYDYAETLAAVGPKAEDALTAQIVEVFKSRTETAQLSALAKGLEAVASQLKAEQANALAIKIVDAITRTRDEWELEALGRTFVAIAPRLKADDANPQATAIIGTMRGMRNTFQLGALGRSLASVARQLRPADAQALANRIVPEARIVAGLKSAADIDQLIALAPVLAGMANRLKAEDARALAGPIVEAMRATTIRDQLKALVQALAAMAPLLRAQDANAVAVQIIEAIRATRHPLQLSALADGLASMKPKAEDAGWLTAQIIDAIRQARNSAQVGALVQALAAMAPRLKPEDARALAATSIAALKQLDVLNTGQFFALAKAIPAIAPQFAPEDAHAFADAVLEIMENKHDPGLTDALVALARHRPWPERLDLFVSALKYPTVYEAPRAVLVKGIKEHPDAGSIKPPGDVWAVVEWLKLKHPGVDLTTPPERVKAGSP